MTAIADTNSQVHVFETATGSSLQYAVTGSGPAVVVLPPAWGIGSDYLRHGLNPLEEHFTFIYLEFRGNARSTRPKASEMISWHLAEDVEHLRRHLGMDRIQRLIGHSGGGTIALWYAIRYPDKVDRLVLLSHQLEGFDDTETLEAVMARKRENPQFCLAIEAWTASWDHLSDMEFAQAIRKFLPVYFHDPEKYAMASKLASLDTVPIWNYHMLHGKHRRTRCQQTLLDRVSAKTLMIFGRDDPICTPTQAMVTQQGIRNSTLAIYDQCGHFPWMESSEETFADMLHHLQR